MIKTVCLIASLSILATVCTSLENQYWKGRFSRNNIQGRFSRDHIPQYWKGRFSRRDEIPQYWKGRFSRDEIPSLNEHESMNEQDEEKRELAGPMQAREVHDNVYEPMNDQYWKGRFMRLRAGGHKRQFSRGMEGGQTDYGMRDAVTQGQDEEDRELVPAEHQEGQEEERNLQSEEAQEQEEEEKRQQEGEEEEEERDVKNDDMQGRFARQGRFKKREENELDAAAKAFDQGRFRREEN